MRIPYGELQTINVTVNNENGHKHVLWRVHYAFVIPCRDCKHSAEKGRRLYCDLNAGGFPEVKPDGFCAWGERRDA